MTDPPDDRDPPPEVLPGQLALPLDVPEREDDGRPRSKLTGGAYNPPGQSPHSNARPEPEREEERPAGMLRDDEPLPYA